MLPHPVFPSSTAFVLPTPSTTSLHTSPVVCPCLRAASPWSQSCARPLLLVGPRGKDCPVGCVPCERARRLRLLVECVVLFVCPAVHLLPRPQIWVAALSAPRVPAPGFGGKCRLRVLRSAPTLAPTFPLPLPLPPLLCSLSFLSSLYAPFTPPLALPPTASSMTPQCPTQMS